MSASEPLTSTWSSSSPPPSLETQAEDMREEMVSHGKGFERHPTLQHYLEMYDEQMDKLRAAVDTEAARGIYSQMVSAKDGFLDALRQLQTSQTGQAVTESAHHFVDLAKAKLDQLATNFSLRDENEERAKIE